MLEQDYYGMVMTLTVALGSANIMRRNKLL